jgi:hypothetical protein
MAISLRNRQQKVPVETAWLRKVGRETLRALERPTADCSVVLVDDAGIGRYDACEFAVAADGGQGQIQSDCVARVRRTPATDFKTTSTAGRRGWARSTAGTWAIRDSPTVHTLT